MKLPYGSVSSKTVGMALGLRGQGVALLEVLEAGGYFLGVRIGGYARPGQELLGPILIEQRARDEDWTSVGEGKPGLNPGSAALRGLDDDRAQGQAGHGGVALGEVVLVGCGLGTKLGDDSALPGDFALQSGVLGWVT